MVTIHHSGKRPVAIHAGWQRAGQAVISAKSAFASVPSTYLFAVGLLTFVVATITPVISAGVPDAASAEEPDLLLSRIGLFFFIACLAGFTAFNRGILIRARELVPVLIGFAGIAFGLSAVNNPEDLSSRAAFSAATIVLFLAFRCVWAIRPDHRQRIFMGAAALIWLQLIVGYVLQGTGDQRWVGGLHPNHFARFATGALFFWTMARGRLDVIPIAVTLVVTVAVSSRTSLVGLLIFIAVFGLLSAQERGSNRKFSYALFGLLLLFSADLLVDGTRRLGQLADQLAIFSDDRGIGSGLSGRTDTYGILFDANTSDILFGMGFRFSRVANVELHSGVLRNFYEFGLPLAALLYGAIFWIIVRQIRTGLQPGRSTQRACAAFALASLPMTFSEPDSIVIGFLASDLFLLALSCPASGIVDTAWASARRGPGPVQAYLPIPEKMSWPERLSGGSD